MSKGKIPNISHSKKTITKRTSHTLSTSIRFCTRLIRAKFWTAPLGGRKQQRGFSIGMASGEARGSCARLCNDFPHLNRRAYVQSVWRVRERCAATTRLSSVWRGSTRVYLDYTGEYTLSHVCTRTIWSSPNFIDRCRNPVSLRILQFSVEN